MITGRSCCARKAHVGCDELTLKTLGIIVLLNFRDEQNYESYIRRRKHTENLSEP
jgi:hypothetical protein